MVVDHLTIARIADHLGVSGHTANTAVLNECRRVLIEDPHRLDRVRVIGVDEHVWRHTRLGDRYVRVVIDLTSVREGTGPARLLDMVEGHPKCLTGIRDIERCPVFPFSFLAFIAAKRQAELETIITDEKLRPEATRAFVENAFRYGRLRTNGTAITKILPPVSRFTAQGGHSEKKRRVIQKRAAFFERLRGLGADGSA